MSEKAVKMSVYEALSKRSIIRKRISKMLGDVSGNYEFFSMATDDATEIGAVPRETVVNELKSNYDTIVALIKNAQAIDKAVAESNALTKIKVGDQEYTVTEALYRMVNIKDETALVEKIQNEANAKRSAAASSNARALFEDNISQYVTTVMQQVLPADATDTDRTAMEKQLRERYIKANTMKVVDPNNLITSELNKKIDELKEFSDEIDMAINMSNIETIIEVTFTE